MAVRDINRNVRGQVVSYPITEEGLLYGNVYFVDKDDGTQSKVARYLNIDVQNNLTERLKNYLFLKEVLTQDKLQEQEHFGEVIFQTL